MRSVNKNSRVYIDGYDLSGYVKSAPQLDWMFAEGAWGAITDPVIGVLPGQVDIRVGTFNGVMDNTATSGLHAVMNSPDTCRDLMVPMGFAAAPAAGAPTFCAQLAHLNYKAGSGEGMVPVTIDFGGWDERSDSKAYAVPWGHLLHPKGAETAVNAGTADKDGAAASALGGFMMYQMFTSDGTVAIKVQDAAANSDASFSDLLTSGDKDASSTPKSGVVALGVTAAVKRYTRWQITLNTATTVTFAVAFVRGIH